MQGCKGAKLTAKKIKVTDKQTSKQTSGVTSSLLELLVAAKNLKFGMTVFGLFWLHWDQDVGLFMFFFCRAPLGPVWTRFPCSGFDLVFFVFSEGYRRYLALCLTSSSS